MQLYFYVLILIFTLSISAKKLDDTAENSNNDDELFVPTHEWQPVRKGQKIPKGLHIRINFETGLTEAKLLDKNEKEKTSAVAEIPQANEIGASDSNSKTAESLKYSEPELKEALKNIKNEDHSEDNTAGNTKKFRSYQELKKDLEDLNLTPKTDAEILNELINKHKRVLKQKVHDESDILLILEDLEYLVHQFDNANEFVNLNGFKEIIFKNLNSTAVHVRREALKLLGSSVQNNAKVQIHALEVGSVGILLRILALDSDNGVKNRAIFALGSLLRRFPVAQLKFLENAGLSVFAELLKKTTNIKIQLKIVTLVNDLVLEHVHVMNDSRTSNYSEKVRQYNQISIKQKLQEHDWCSSLNDLLINIFTIDKNDHDSIEKCLSAIAPIIDNCDAVSITSIQGIVQELRLFYENIIELEEERGEDFEYYTHLWNLCRQITEYSNYKYKTEL